MEKEQIISLIQTQLQIGAISKEDLLALAAGTGIGEDGMPSAQPHKNLVNVFYGIGAIIVLTGIVILVAQHWEDIGYIGRLLVTAGIAAATFAAGLILKGQRVLSQALFTLSAALAPLGAYVVLTENGVSFGLTEQLIIGVALAALFGFAWFLSRRSILVLLIAFNLTWAYYAGLLKAVEGMMYMGDLLTWATVLAGAAYILAGFGYKGNAVEGESVREGRSVRSLLYGLGTLATLGAGFSLEGVWDLVYIPLLFAAFYLSVYLKTRAMLVFAGIFLIAHLVYLTSKYFVDSIGWPIALVICGFIIIGIGYATFYVMRRYMK